MRRDYAFAGALWLILTVIGEVLALSVEFYPAVGSDKGEEIEKAFRILMILAVPVFTLVVAVLILSMLRHRTGDVPPEDGPAHHGRGPVPLTWVGVTAGLTLLVMIYPGLTSLSDVVGNDPNPEVVVQVEGIQWTWLISYPEHDISAKRELVLPVDRTVRFEIRSRDVLHSFWVPAFLMKIDAVPGMTTTVTLRPTEIGSFQTDRLLRVQCAELCGLGHAQMRIPVRVVDDQDFEDWLAEQQEAAAGEEPTPVVGAQEFTIIGENILFDIEDIQAEADRQVVITFDNRDEAVFHNWALYETEEAATSGAAPIAGSPIEVGPLTQTIAFDAPDPGTYFYRCDVHPQIMTGTLVVE